MTPLTVVTGPAAPFLRRDVDTDLIIRVERCTGIPREALGPYALEALRGPSFVLDRHPFRGAPILLAGANFGCGSSREMAVWALQALNLRCVVAPSFGDIFEANCFQNGLLPVVLPEETVARLAALTEDGRSLTVDLQREEVVAPDGNRHAFATDPLRREMLLEGLDELDLTLRRAGELETWRRADAKRRPWAYPTATAAQIEGLIS